MGIIGNSKWIADTYRRRRQMWPFGRILKGDSFEEIEERISSSLSIAHVIRKIRSKQILLKTEARCRPHYEALAIKREMDELDQIVETILRNREGRDEQTER